MKKIKILAFSVLVFFPFYSLAASSLTLSPPGGTVKIGETFKITVFANPNGGALDTIRTKINFPKEMVEVQSFSLNSSFEYQSGGNDLGNVTGQLSWGSGIAGGISQSSAFGTITFKAKKEGQATVSVSPESLVLSAGQNSFNGQSSSAVFQISPSLEDPLKVQPTTPKVANPAPQQKLQQIKEGKTEMEKGTEKNATSTVFEDSFLSQTGPESQESIFPPSQAADLSEALPLIQDLQDEKRPLFNRTNKIILGAMISILLLIGWAIWRLKDKEITV